MKIRPRPVLRVERSASMEFGSRRWIRSRRPPRRAEYARRDAALQPRRAALALRAAARLPSRGKGLWSAARRAGGRQDRRSATIRRSPTMPRPRHPIVLIPARLASTRLPDKPLAEIHGEPMIVHVWRRAMEAELGPVVVACGDEPIAAAVRKAGGMAVMTRADHPSGSDRIFEALTAIDPGGRHDAIVNVQGDLPTIARATIRASLDPLETDAVDIATLAVEITREEERTAPHVVKPVIAFGADKRIGR